jgi:hypothetical protein
MTYGQLTRKYSNEFLNIGVDAAGLGMSKSVTAIASDVNALYWNPAGLSKITVNQGSLMHMTHFAGIGSYDHIAVAIAPKEKEGAVLAFSIIRFGVDDILDTTDLIDSDGNIDVNRIQLFSAADYAFNFGVGSSVKKVPNLHVGLNAKIIRRTVGDFASSWGFGLDAGIQYQLGSWQLGLMARDFTTTYNFWRFDQDNFEKIKGAIPNKNQELPEKNELTLPKIHFGIAKEFQLKNKNFHLLSELDMHIRFAETNDLISSSSASMSPSLGFQLDYEDFVFLRAGVGNFQKITEFDDRKTLALEPNIGLGFRYHGISIDYALSNIASVGNALYSNTFSVKIDFDFLKKTGKNI